jgi:uncharacterized protein YutE (UPF0331/DUF86 family)
MELSRAKRYKDKVSKIIQNIRDIKEWASSEEVFLEDRKTRLATYKAFQEAVEAITDIVAMMVKDLGEIPKDDYTNLEIIHNKNIISSELKKAIKEANGLRNRVVHEYNGIVDEVAYASIMSLLEYIEEFTRVTEKWLLKNL